MGRVGMVGEVGPVGRVGRVGAPTGPTSPTRPTRPTSPTGLPEQPAEEGEVAGGDSGGVEAGGRGAESLRQARLGASQRVAERQAAGQDAMVGVMGQVAGLPLFDDVGLPSAVKAHGEAAGGLPLDEGGRKRLV